MTLLRTATKQDLPAISLLIKNMYSEKGIVVQSDLLSKVYFESSDEFYVAEFQNKIVGLVCTVPSVRNLIHLKYLPSLIFSNMLGFVMPNYLRLYFAGRYIPILAVDKTHRRTGIGQTLLKKVLTKPILSETRVQDKPIRLLLDNLNFKTKNKFTSKLFKVEIRKFVKPD